MRPWCDELNAEWLPLACDPEIHTPRTYSEEYDLAWVGGPWASSPLYEKRFKTMAALSQKYRCNFKSGVYFEDMANVYGSARIGWHMSVTGKDLDMRVFEVMCSGRPLVTDDAPDSGIGDLFIQEGHYAAYRTEEEMDWLVRVLVADPDSAAIYGKYARDAVLSAHTYRHRAHQLMQAVGLE